MAQFVNMRKVDLMNGEPAVFSLRQLYYADQEANRIGAIVYMGGEPYALAGTCTGTAIRADGTTVPMQGTVDGNQAYITLIPDCYAIEGSIQIFVKITIGDVVATLAAAVGTVRLTETEAVIDPGEIIPSVSALITSINDAIASIPADYSDLLAAIAPDYTDLTFPVAAGTWCWYSGSLHRAKVDIPASETWTAAHWDSTPMSNALAGDIADLKSELNIEKNLSKNGTSAFPIDWESGRIGGTGTNTPDDYSIRSVGYVDNIAGETLAISCNITGLTNTAFLKINKYSLSGTYDSAGSVQIRATEMPTEVTLDSDYLYRLVWRMSDNSRTPLPSDIDILIKSEMAYIPSVIQTALDNQQDGISGLETDVAAIRAGNVEVDVTWETGGINSLGNNSSIITNAMRSVGFVDGLAGNDIAITAAAGLTNYFYLTIYKYNQDGTYVSDSSQIVYYRNMPTSMAFPSGYKYRLMWRSTDETSVLADQITLKWDMQIEYVPDAVEEEIIAKRYNLGTAATLVELASRNPFRFSALEEAKISFVWDGPYADLDKVAAIFKGYNFPICVGATPSFMYATASGLSEPSNGYTVGMSMPDLLAKIVEDGGEIMVHPDGLVTASNQDDYDAMYDYFVSDKEKIESYGFSVRGQVRHGGSGIVTGTPQIEKWLIGNYEYGNNGTADNYNLQRIDINQTLANLKAAVDNAVANKTWLRFMCHSLDSSLSANAVSEEILTGLLDYIAGLNVDVVTYAAVFDDKKSSVLLEYLNSVN